MGYVDLVVNDHTDCDSGKENKHEVSGLSCFSETTGKVKPERLSVMGGHTDIAMELDTGEHHAQMFQTLHIMINYLNFYCTTTI